VTLSSAGRRPWPDPERWPWRPLGRWPCPPGAGQTRGHPVLGRPATFSRGDPALRRPQVARHRRLRPFSPVRRRLLR